MSNVGEASSRAGEFGAGARRSTRQVRVGHVLIGGDAPIMVQSMTNTDTADAEATAVQVAQLARASRIYGRLQLSIANALDVMRFPAGV